MALGRLHLVATSLFSLVTHGSIFLQLLPLVFFSLYAISRAVKSTPLLLSAVLIMAHHLSLALIVQPVPDSGPNVPTGHVHFMSRT